jgi:hypothetical protein
MDSDCKWWRSKINSSGFKNASQTITPSSVNGDLNFTAIYRAKITVCRNIERCNFFYGQGFYWLDTDKGNWLTKINSIWIPKQIVYRRQTGFYIYDLIPNKIVYSNKKNFKTTSFYIDKANTLSLGHNKTE